MERAQQKMASSSRYSAFFSRARRAARLRFCSAGGAERKASQSATSADGLVVFPRLQIGRNPLLQGVPVERVEKCFHGMTL